MYTVGLIYVNYNKIAITTNLTMYYTTSTCPYSLIVSTTNVSRSKNEPTATLNFLASTPLNVLERGAGGNNER